MCTRSVIVLHVISCNSFYYVHFDYLVIALITWTIKLIFCKSYLIYASDYLVITLLCFDYLVVALIIL
jgi:hypothetical protein